MFGGSRPFGTSGTAAPAFGAAAPAAGSAFGAAGTTAFGSTATAAPAFGGATTSLFGSTATTQQPAATGGLFGAPAASAAPAGTTGGLFGRYGHRNKGFFFVLLLLFMVSTSIYLELTIQGTNCNFKKKCKL